MKAETRSSYNQKNEAVDKYSRLWLVRTCAGHMIETIPLTHVQKSTFTLLTHWPWQTKKSSFAMMTLFFISPSIIRSPTGTFHLLDTRSVAQSSFLFLRHPLFLSLLHSPAHPQSFSSLPKSQILFFLSLHHMNCQHPTHARVLSIRERPIMASLWSCDTRD